MINKNVKRKMITAFATSALLLGAVVPSAFADSIHISGNGAFSENNVSVRQSNRTSVDQRNDTNIRNNVWSNSNTGNNRSSFNTSGDNYIHTGNANNRVEISNNGGFNYANTGGSHSWNWDNENNDSHKDSSRNDRNLQTSLNGNNEVPGPGDSDGRGSAEVKLHPSKDELCVNIHVKNIETATAAHIHEAQTGVAGPVVVTLPTPNADGYVEGCVSVAKEKLKEMKDNPSDYYVNVHNTTFPNGAVRGQLSN